jgi:hypothetical protein
MFPEIKGNIASCSAETFRHVKTIAVLNIRYLYLASCYHIWTSYYQIWHTYIPTHTYLTPKDNPFVTVLPCNRTCYMYRCVLVEFVEYGIGIPPPPPPDAIYLPTQPYAQVAAVVTVCLHPPVPVPNSSGAFVTATKPLLTPPSSFFRESQGSTFPLCMNHNVIQCDNSQ